MNKKNPLGRDLGMMFEGRIVIDAIHTNTEVLDYARKCIREEFPGEVNGLSWEFGGLNIVAFTIEESESYRYNNSKITDRGILYYIFSNFGRYVEGREFKFRVRTTSVSNDHGVVFRDIGVIDVDLLWMIDRRKRRENLE